MTRPLYGCTKNLQNPTPSIEARDGAPPPARDHTAATAERPCPRWREFGRCRSLALADQRIQDARALHVKVRCNPSCRIVDDSALPAESGINFFAVHDGQQSKSRKLHERTRRCLQLPVDHGPARWPRTHEQLPPQPPHALNKLGPSLARPLSRFRGCTRYHGTADSAHAQPLKF